MRITSSLVALTTFLALLLIAAPSDAAAQGRGRGHGHDKRDRAGRIDRNLEDMIFGRPGDRPVRRGNGSGKVPPGWCRGVGNPHNTPENCGWNSEIRNRNRNDRSFADAHERFHRLLDERYRRLAAQRPLDLAYQLELQLRKRTEHERWHQRAGR